MINPPVPFESVYLPNGLGKVQTPSLSISSYRYKDKKAEDERILVPFVSSHANSSTLSQYIVSCKESLANIFEKSRFEVFPKEDQWEQNFIRRVTCISLSSFRCMEYGRLFPIAMKKSSSSLPSVAYPNLLAFTLFWLAQGIGNAVLIYKNPNINSHKTEKISYCIACIAKYSITCAYFCGSILDLEMHATTIRQGRGGSDQDIVDIAVVLVVLDSISLLNELVYFSAPVFTKVKQLFARKAFTGSFFSTGMVSRLDDEPVEKNMAVLRSCVSKVRSACSFSVLGVASAVAITNSYVHWKPYRDGFSSEHIVFVERILTVCCILVILFGYMMRW